MTFPIICPPGRGRVGGGGWPGGRVRGRVGGAGGPGAPGRGRVGGAGAPGARGRERHRVLGGPGGRGWEQDREVSRWPPAKPVSQSVFALYHIIVWCGSQTDRQASQWVQCTEVRNWLVELIVNMIIFWSSPSGRARIYRGSQLQRRDYIWGGMERAERGRDGCGYGKLWQIVTRDTRKTRVPGYPGVTAWVVV